MWKEKNIEYRIPWSSLAEGKSDWQPSSCKKSHGLGQKGVCVWGGCGSLEATFSRRLGRGTGQEPRVWMAGT